MIKIINYALAITIISVFTMLNAGDLSASNTKKCKCPTTKIIKNKKYICKKSTDNRCICKLAPVVHKSKSSNSNKKKEIKKTHNKKSNKNTSKSKNTKATQKIAPKAVNPVNKKEVKTKTPIVAPVVNNDNTSKPTNISTPKEIPVVKKSINPLIIVNRFEEDPTFSASIRGILYGVNAGINIIDVANTNETTDVLVQSYKLLKTSSMWGENAVFISGSTKQKIESTIIIVKSKNNQFFVTQNSGVITFIKDTIGISEVRKLQRVNFKSETLNGRDIEYLIGAKLIDNPSNFDNMGEKININHLNTFNYLPLKSTQMNISSLFVVEDKSNGNIFTFIPSEKFNKFNPQDNDIFKIVLSNGMNIILEQEAIYKNSRTYYGGTEAIILDYKSSIGTYIAIKNLQSSALSTLANNGKFYKVSISPIAKGKPVDISNIENTDSAQEKSTIANEQELILEEKENITPSKKPVVSTPQETEIQNIEIPLDEEKSKVVPYSTRREASSDSLIKENTTQNPKEANIKDLQKYKNPTNREVNKENLTPKNNKSLTDNQTKSIYPSAGRNNLEIKPEEEIDASITKKDNSKVNYKEEIKKLDKEIDELEVINDNNSTDEMIDEDNNTSSDRIKGISSTNSYIDEEDGVLLSKLVSNDTKKTSSK